ncbi:hypothetical protein ACHHYP_17032 [Achlya hypogyna]|uniref:Uncharacterized protein n=1 Tax=Achlya hypogyna TaxID=1202772 RepID=A0A1V9ZDN8_ACHHY|nr:hypothetical protein ACHHYP_17032 [Achlya hypogyna]
MADGCPALDALEREYAAVVNQRPIPPMDFTDMEEEEICHHGDEHQMLHSDSEEEVPLGYEPLHADSDDEDEDEDEEKGAATSTPSQQEKMSVNDVQTIQNAMQQLSLPAPSWGKNLSDEQLMALIMPKPTTATNHP